MNDKENEVISSQEDILENSSDITTSDVEESSSTVTVDALTDINNNLVFLDCFLIAELGIVIGILLGLVWKGITKK